jgi:hypothetical protein
MVLSEVEGLTTLSKPVESLKVERVEGESSVVSDSSVTECRISPA